MKYILMMNTMKAGHGVPSWPKKDLQAHIAFMMGSTKSCTNAASWYRRKGCRSPIRRSWCTRARMAGPSRTVFSGIQGVPRRLLDHRCRQSTTSI
jgi:hypothetical protein